MRDLIINITNDALDTLDMSLGANIDNEEYQGYFKDVSSKEHYRLLTYLSKNIHKEVVVDVGTLKGCSALALSANPLNRVYSFNLHNELQLKDIPKNIEFIVDNVISGKYDDILLKSKIILLDTFHDGTFEIEFLNYIKSLGYSGILLLDDIHLNKEMKLFWDGITEDKLDISNVGHSSGTGVVFM